MTDSVTLLNDKFVDYFVLNQDNSGYNSGSGSDILDIMVPTSHKISVIVRSVPIFFMMILLHLHIPWITE